MTFYKLRKKGTETIFSTGGLYAQLVNENTSRKLGKRWAKLGHVKAHLTQYRSRSEDNARTAANRRARFHLEQWTEFWTPDKFEKWCESYERKAAEDLKYIDSVEVVEYVTSSDDVKAKNVIQI